MSSEMHASELIKVVILRADVVDNHSKIPGGTPREAECCYVVLQ